MGMPFACLKAIDQRHPIGQPQMKMRDEAMIDHLLDDCGVGSPLAAAGAIAIRGLGRAEADEAPGGHSGRRVRKEFVLLEVKSTCDLAMARTCSGRPFSWLN